MDTTIIDDACCGLQRSVERFVKKHQHRFQQTNEDNAHVKLTNRIATLVRHAQHILQTLTRKRASLEHAVAALYECWEKIYTTILENTNSNNSTAAAAAAAAARTSNLQSVLQHVLQCYLRLGDGMVLLASGECRHPGDIKSVKYKSNLTMNQIRGDGYTMLYSKDLIYSGFGWDEFFDAKCGVQEILLNALARLAGGSKSKTRIWDTLLEHGAQLFESTLDTHETKLHMIRKSLEDFRERVKGDLTKLLPNRKITFGTQDKMEYLEVRGSFKLLRRANEFQIKGEDGVLPNGWTAAQWNAHLALPSRIRNQLVTSQKLAVVDTKKRQRRRVIVDSDDDGDDNEAGGVHVLKTKTAEIVSTNMSSLNAIKSDFGVDAAELETAREQLESEHLQQNDKAEDDAVDSEDGNIKNRRARVAKLKKALCIVVDAKEDALEIWDVREHLRKETMQLGNDLLALQGLQNLIDAKDCFVEAMELVQQQEAAHKVIVQGTGDMTDEVRLIRRNLLLLKGRAQTNFGIALLELSLVAKAPSVTRKKDRAAAAISLTQARRCAQKLQDLAADDWRRGASPSEAALDIVDAVQLEVLAWRSYGSIMWHDGKETDSVRAFEDAASAHTKIDKSIMVFVDKGGEFLEHYLDILMECYFSLTSLFDLAAAKLEQLPIAGSPLPVVASSNKQKGEFLLSTTSNAVEEAKPIIAMIEKFTQNRQGFDHYLDENGVLTEEGMNAALDDVRQIWQERVDGASVSRKSLNLPKKVDSDLRRSHLGMGLFLSRNGNRPTRRFVADSDTARRSKHKRHGAADGDFRYAPASRQEDVNQPSVLFMKWGDELLSLNQTSAAGGLTHGLPYPACAPPLPPAMRSFQNEMPY